MKRILWIAVVLFWARCASSTDESLNSASVMVDLGTDNDGAIAAYDGFDASRCGSATTAVLAFKKFGGGKRNATQDGADALVNQAEVGIDEPTAISQKPTAEVDRQAGESEAESDLLLTANADVDVDVIDIDGEPTCVVRAPVNLYTPAIARKIAEQGTVRNFYMTGQRSGEGYVEAGALNNIDPNHEFYDANGKAIEQKNSSNRIDESADHNATTASNFDQKAISSATGIEAATAPRTANDYICNATNYVLSQQGELSYLPGLKFKPLPNAVRTGFVHVPDTATAEQVAQIIRQTIQADRAARAAH